MSVPPFYRRRRAVRVARAQRVVLPSSRGAPTAAEVEWLRVLHHGELVGMRCRAFALHWSLPPAEELS